MPQLRKNSFARTARQDSSSGPQRKLPVFVTPSHLEYILSDRSTHKQIVTVYNPYDFLIHFKVLCTAPKNYHVGEAKGIVKPQCCSDVVIRLINLQDPTEKEDKFRIEVSQAEPALGQGQKFKTVLLGVKEIVSEVVPRPPVPDKIDLPQLEQTQSYLEQTRPEDPSLPKGEILSGKWLMISIAVVCLCALATHTTGQEDESSFIPTYYSLTSNQKMVASYILGEKARFVLFKLLHMF